MLSYVNVLGRLSLLAVALASFGISGCAATTQADNAAEFKELASRAGHEVTFEATDESRPGLVVGAARSDDGLQVRFAFSFGPGPDTLEDELRKLGTTWVDLGDRFEYWIKGAPPGLVGSKADRYARMILDLEGIGCRVVTDRPCNT